jgi:hypothetical protein
MAQERVVVRIVAALLAVVLAGNGVVMLFAGPWWYDAVPGVTATGPYNAHFVRDIGSAYLVAGGGLAAFAMWPRIAWPALVASAAFQLLHVGVHVFDAVCGTKLVADVARDFAGVYAPAILTVLIAFRRPPQNLPRTA